MTKIYESSDFMHRILFSDKVKNAIANYCYFILGIFCKICNTLVRSLSEALSRKKYINNKKAINFKIFDRKSSEIQKDFMSKWILKPCEQLVRNIHAYIRKLLSFL